MTKNHNNVMERDRQLCGRLYVNSGYAHAENKILSYSPTNMGIERE